MLDREGGNEAIKSLIRADKPFLVNRMRSEMDVIFKMMTPDQKGEAFASPR